jgi:protein-tyrosine phosphatase
MEDLLRREGLEDEVEVDSAGLGSYHVGDPPDPRAQESARGRGLDLASQRARQVAVEDLEGFDYVLVMDDMNRDGVAALDRTHDAKVRLLMEYAEDRAETQVPDPYYGGPDGFERVMDLVSEACEGLLADIRRRHFGRG